MTEQISTELMAFICKNFFVEKEDIDPDKSMIDEGIIDSFGLIEIASYMEKKYNINVGEDKMIRANFGSFNKMVSFIIRETELVQKD